MYVYVHVQYVYTAIYMYVQVVQVSYIHRSSYIISEISHFFLPLSGYMIWDVYVNQEIKVRSMHYKAIGVTGRSKLPFHFFGFFDLHV